MIVKKECWIIQNNCLFNLVPPTFLIFDNAEVDVLAENTQQTKETTFTNTSVILAYQYEMATTQDPYKTHKQCNCRKTGFNAYAGVNRKLKHMQVNVFRVMSGKVTMHCEMAKADLVK